MALDKDRSVRIVKQEAEQRYTLGVVYEPMVKDAHGDMATEDEIEQAAYRFMEKLQHPADVTASVSKIVTSIAKGEECRIDVTDLLDGVQKARGPLRDMHTDDDSPAPGVIVESYITPVAFVVDGIGVQKGTWLMGIKWAPESFEKIKTGERSGLSLGGRAFRVPRKVGDDA